MRIRTSLGLGFGFGLLALTSQCIAFQGKTLLVKSGGLIYAKSVVRNRALPTSKSNNDMALLPEPVYNNKIPFVGRHAEVFDVVATNLINCVELAPFAQCKVAIAAQVRGSGKTVLGANVIRALNRPRESPQEEERVAQCLMSARQLWYERKEEIIRAALCDPRNESLTVRAVRALLKDNHPFSEEQVDELVDDFKRARTVFVSIADLNSGHETLGGAITNAIAEETLAKKKANDECVKSLRALLVRDLQKGSLFIVLDGIDHLIHDRKFAKWAHKTDYEEVDRAAMRSLSSALVRMLCVPGVRVYCTGHADHISLSALTGYSELLLPTPIMLNPLRAQDIEDMFTLAAEQQSPVSALNLSRIATDPKVIRTLSEKLAGFSGGNGRAVECALEFLHEQSPPLISTEDAAISAANMACQHTLNMFSDVRDRALQFSKLFTPETSALIRHHLQSSEPFEEHLEVELTPLKGSSKKNRMRLKDVLSALGLSYTATGPYELRATSGDLQFALLPDTLSWKREEQLKTDEDTKGM